MKKMVAITLTVLLCAAAMTVQAGHKKKGLSPEQQAVQKEMLDKYDTNKDGKLDKEELAKIPQEDQDKMAKAGLLKHHKQDGAQAGAQDGAADAAPKAPDDNAGAGE